MAFHFVLAPLLRLRESVERQRALRLREASVRVIQMQDRLEQLDRFLKDSEARDEQHLRAGVKAVELQFAVMSRGQVERLKTEWQDELRNLESARQKAAEEYQQAYRESEALETLRQQQRRQYQKEDLRRQQRDLDVVFLLQHWRNR